MTPFPVTPTRSGQILAIPRLQSNENDAMMSWLEAVDHR